MATLWRGRGVRIYVPSDDHIHPPHVHASYGGCRSKWHLDGWRIMERGDGCSGGDLRKIRRALIRYEARILEAWHDHWRQIENGRGG